MKKDDDDTAAKALDRRLEQLLILTLINSLRRREDHGADDDNFRGATVKEDILSLGDQLAISKELMIVAQRLIDAQLLDLWRDEDKTHIMPSLPAPKILQSSSSSSVSPDQQLMCDDEAAAIGKKNSAAAAKKKRYRKNKSAAKHKKKTSRMSWLGGFGILPQIVMMALSSITTLIVTFAIIHQRVDGSSEGGGATPALPPTSSKSLLRSPYRLTNIDNNVASSPSSKPDIINSPSEVLVPSPVLSPTEAEVSASVVSRGMQLYEVKVTILSTGNSSSSPFDVQPGCFHTPNWTDFNETGCDWYESEDRCSNDGTEWAAESGLATEHVSRWWIIFSC